MKELRFELGAAVAITTSGEAGVVVARAEYQTSQDQYLVRYKTADGRATESWWGDDALEQVHAEA